MPSPILLIDIACCFIRTYGYVSSWLRAVLIDFSKKKPILKADKLKLFTEKSGIAADFKQAYSPNRLCVS